jgi:hypothetical protein
MAIQSYLKSVSYINLRRLDRFLRWAAMSALALSLSACSTGGEYLVTRAKLQNLKVTMSVLTTYFVQNDDDFPTDREEIVDFMIAEAGIEVRDRENDHPFEDGWGNMMRLSGGLNKYEIRSAGPDEQFNTDDDIYLEGNDRNEYIIDGVKEQNASAKSLLASPIKVAYQEPNGYYKFELPGKYAVIDNGRSWTSDITFRYNPANTVRVVADPGGGRRDPDQEMAKRLRMLEGGRDELLGGYTVTESKLVKIDRAPGFMIALEDGDRLARLYEITSQEGISYSVLIKSSGEERAYIMDALDGAARQGLKLRR